MDDTRKRQMNKRISVVVYQRKNENLTQQLNFLKLHITLWLDLPKIHIHRNNKTRKNNTIMQKLVKYVHLCNFNNRREKKEPKERY